jgi:hypothetical protein
VISSNRRTPVVTQWSVSRRRDLCRRPAVSAMTCRPLTSMKVRPARCSATERRPSSTIILRTRSSRGASTISSYPQIRTSASVAVLVMRTSMLDVRASSPSSVAMWKSGSAPGYRRSSRMAEMHLVAGLREGELHAQACSSTPRCPLRCRIGGHVRSMRLAVTVVSRRSSGAGPHDEDVSNPGSDFSSELFRPIPLRATGDTGTEGRLSRVLGPRSWRAAAGISSPARGRTLCVKVMWTPSRHGRPTSSSPACNWRWGEPYLHDSSWLQCHGASERTPRAGNGIAGIEMVA